MSDSYAVASYHIEFAAMFPLTTTCCWWITAMAMTCTIALYRFSVSTFGKWRKLNVPYAAGPVPLFGNFLDVALGIVHPVDFYRKIYNQLAGHRYGGLFQMRTPYLMIRDPELIGHVLIKDFSYFPDRGVHSDLSVNPLSDNLFFMDNPRWKVIRSKLSPAFTSGKLKLMYDQVKECADGLTRTIDERLATDGVEVRDVIGDFSTDVISTCAFGLKPNVAAGGTSAFRRYGKSLFVPSLRILLRELCLLIDPVLLKVVRLKDFPSDAVEFFHSVFRETITYREQNNVVRNDFVQVLMQARNDLVLKENLSANGKHVISR